MTAHGWRASDVSRDRSWEHTLTPSEAAEIVGAARTAVASGMTLDAVSRDSFPLPGLSGRLTEWNRQISGGLGFVLIHGFPVDQLSAEEIEFGYVGLGEHLGRRVGQNRDGDLLTHIRDDRVPQTSGIKRLYRTRERQDFHSDGADIIGLLCLHAAKSGGESRIVSSRAVYDEMMVRRPELVDELRATFHWDRQDDHAPGEQPWFALSPIFDLDGEPRIFYIGWYIRNAQRHAGVPRLTAAQEEAMQMLEGIANDPQFHVTMEFEPGDIQLLNNGRVLHAREAYEDHDDPDKRRHLLRLWLAAHDFASVEEGLRAGMGKVK